MIALEFVRKSGSQWFVYSHKGKKLSKGYSSKAAADKRLREIEYFKHKDEAIRCGHCGTESEVTDKEKKSEAKCLIKQVVEGEDPQSLIRKLL